MDAAVEEEIPNMEAGDLEVAREKSVAQDENRTLPEYHEEVDTQALRDELNDGENIELAEASTAIYIRKGLDAQMVDPSCIEILSGNGRKTEQFIETEDGVLQEIPPGEVDAPKIVVLEALRP